MRHLYLMRHAKAKSSRADLADHRRPLRRRGRHQAEAMAAPLQRWGALEGDIHVSSARRCLQTLEAVDSVLPGLGVGDRIQLHDDLYTFEGQALLEWLRRLPEASERVLVIGHNPALLQLARWLCPEAPASLPTGGLVCLALPVPSWQALARHGAELTASLTPAEASHDLFKRRAPGAPDLRKADPASRVHALLCHQYRLVRALEPGVIAGIDPEFLHQYRVNLRRSRAIGESLLAIARVPGLKKRLKRLKRRAQATSELRDLHVFLESLDARPAPLSERIRMTLHDWLAARERERHEALCRQLGESEYAEEMAAWQAFLDGNRFQQALAGLDSRRVDRVLVERIAEHDRELAALGVASPDEAFHDLRKGVKRIRYLAELDPKRHRRLLKGLKRRQGVLGDFQDLCSRQAWIEAFAAASRNAPRRRQECAAWCAALEEQKRDLREQVVALAPLAS